jgi:hypothetical protein
MLDMACMLDMEGIGKNIIQFFLTMDVKQYRVHTILIKIEKMFVPD